jgi:hypothetical protein
METSKIGRVFLRLVSRQMRAAVEFAANSLKPIATTRLYGNLSVGRSRTETASTAVVTAVQESLPNTWMLFPLLHLPLSSDSAVACQ